MEYWVLVFLLLAFCLQINYPILCYYCLIDLPLLFGWFALILRELEFIGLISSLLTNLSMFGMLIFSINWEISFGQLWRDSAWVFLRVLLRDRLRHPVWVLETPGLAYEEGKSLEDCLTKLLMFISTVHTRSLLIFSLNEEIFPEVMKIITHN